MPIPLEYWDLERREGSLVWAGCGLRGVAERHGTPLYVVNGERLRRNIHRFVDAVRGAFDGAGIYHPVKTSGIPDILPIMAEGGIGAEAAAGHEIEICRRLGIPGEMIIFGGVNRRAEEFALALGAEVHTIILDNLDELHALRDAAGGSSRQARVALRVALGIRAKSFLPLQNSSSAKSPYGFEPAGGEFRDALRLLRDAQGLRLTGLHSHIGTGIRAIKPFVRNARKIVRLYAALRAEGFSLETLNVGGGLGAPGAREFSALEFLLYAAAGRLPAAPQTPRGEQTVRYVAGLRGAVEEACRACSVPVPRLQFEPGRILTSDAVLLLLRVGAVKRRGKGESFACLDGGAMSVGLSSLAEHHAMFPVDACPGEEERYTFIGRVPTALDLLYRNRRFPKLRGGEYIAFMDAGAYMIPTATNFASLKPAILFCAEGGERLLRRREVAGDLLAGRADG